MWLQHWGHRLLPWKSLFIIFFTCLLSIVQCTVRDIWQPAHYMSLFALATLNEAHITAEIASVSKSIPVPCNRSAVTQTMCNLNGRYYICMPFLYDKHIDFCYGNNSLDLSRNKIFAKFRKLIKSLILTEKWHTVYHSYNTLCYVLQFPNLLGLSMYPYTACSAL